MDQHSKRRGRLSPDAMMLKPIVFNLEEALSVENTYRPNLLVFNQLELKPGEVTLASRDGAVQILRFLRTWFDLTHTVFFNAVSYLDMFLAKMKVQQKYLKCLTVSCFYLAAFKDDSNINIKELVLVSQSNCSVKDMLRMADVVKEKLKLNDSKPTTVADFLKLYLEIFGYMARPYKKVTEVLEKQQLFTRLEVILADSSTAFFRSSTLALALIQIELEKLTTQGLSRRSVCVLGERLHLLPQSCKIKTAELKNCCVNVSKVLNFYDGGHKSKHSQKLSWRFSQSMLEKAYRHRNFHTLLRPIREEST